MTANFTGGVGGGQLNWVMGNNTDAAVTPMGGFKMFQRVGWSTTPANGQGCVGMFGTTAPIPGPGGVGCNQMLNSTYFGWNKTVGFNTTMGIYSNDASGNATRAVDCGANFPSPLGGAAGANAVYSVTIFARPSQANISVFVDREDKPNITPCSTTLTTDIPANTTFLTWRAFCSNGGSASACSVDIYKVYMSKDN